MLLINIHILYFLILLPVYNMLNNHWQSNINEINSNLNFILPTLLTPYLYYIN